LYFPSGLRDCKAVGVLPSNTPVSMHSSTVQASHALEIDCGQELSPGLEGIDNRVKLDTLCSELSGSIQGQGALNHHRELLVHRMLRHLTLNGEWLLLYS